MGRLSYETTEKRLHREMEQFGPIKQVKIVYDFAGKSRGYGFVEFEKVFMSLYMYTLGISGITC